MKTLFHYCGNAAFMSIIEKKAIWLSDASLSNDTMEGRWINHIAAEYASAQGLSGQRADLFNIRISTVSELWLGLALCLSEDGDVLSQWRGYAEDGTGVSIGFSDNVLSKQCASLDGGTARCALVPVIYDPEKQIDLLKSTLDFTIGKFQSGELDYRHRTIMSDPDEYDEWLKRRDVANHEVLEQLIKLFPYIHSFKNPAFSEEREWRMILQVLVRGGAPDYTDCEYRSARNKLVPYRPIEIDNDEPAIIEVILGPKNETPIPVIQAFLRKCGFPSAKVSQSKATYR